MDISIVGCILPFLTLKEAEAWAMASKCCYRLIMDNPVHRKRAGQFLTRAVKGFAFVRKNGSLFGREEGEWRCKLMRYRAQEIDILFGEIL